MSKRGAGTAKGLTNRYLGVLQSTAGLRAIKIVYCALGGSSIGVRYVFVFVRGAKRQWFNSLKFSLFPGITSRASSNL
jgi:hypothetical protein